MPPPPAPPPRSWRPPHCRARARLLAAALALALGACAAAGGPEQPDPTPAPGGQEGQMAGTIEAENLEEDLPVQVEDTYPIGFSDQEVQGLARYAAPDDDAGDDVLLAELRLVTGLGSNNAQASLVLPYSTEGGIRTGTMTLGAFYNFFTETGAIPAMAVKGEAGIETTQLEFIATKSLGAPRGGQRVHLNLAWAYRYDPGPDQRRDRYTAVLGYSQFVGTDNLVVVADVVREQAATERVEVNLAEAGFRWQLSRFWILAGGVGVGIGAESPAFRAAIGFQRGLALFR